MVDYQRQMLDELMGRNRNLDPGQKAKEKSWKDGDNCKFFIVSDFQENSEEKPGKIIDFNQIHWFSLLTMKTLNYLWRSRTLESRAYNYVELNSNSCNFLNSRLALKLPIWDSP